MSELQATPNCKIILLGNTSVGKTSIVLQFYQNTFFEEARPTVGTAYVSKTVETKKGRINLNIWDTAGQERFHSIIPMYLKGSHAVIIVCSPDDEKSMEDLEKWRELLAKHVDEEKVKVFVVYNKVDLCNDNSFLRSDVPSNFAQSHHYQYFETSAKNRININELFQDIAESVAETIKFESNNVSVAQAKDTKENKSSCC